MNSKILARAVLCVLSLFAINVNADVRVLVEYDQHAHRVLQVVELAAKNAVPISDHLRTDDRNKLLANVLQADNGFVVSVLWTSGDGRLLEKDIIADPRSIHAPITTEEPRPSIVGLEKGAYMLDGPAGSAFVEIHLPAHSGLGLGAQSWRFDLSR